MSHFESNFQELTQFLYKFLFLFLFLLHRWFWYVVSLFISILTGLKNLHLNKWFILKPVNFN